MIEKLQELPLLIGVKHAKELGLSRYHFNQLLQTKGVPTVRIGSKSYIDRDGLIAYLENQSKEKNNEI